MKAIAFKSILSATALAVTVGISVNASAEQIDETVVHGQAVETETVSFKRSELSTADGREAVIDRIHRAAEAVCGSQDYRRVGSMTRLSENRECFNEAVDQAMSDLGADQLATIDG